MSFQLENLSHQDWNQPFRISSRPAISLARSKVDMCSVSPARSLAQTTSNVLSLLSLSQVSRRESASEHWPALSSFLHQAVTASPVCCIISFDDLVRSHCRCVRKGESRPHRKATGSMWQNNQLLSQQRMTACMATHTIKDRHSTNLAT